MKPPPTERAMSDGDLAYAWLLGRSIKSLGGPRAEERLRILMRHTVDVHVAAAAQQSVLMDQLKLAAEETVLTVEHHPYLAGYRAGESAGLYRAAMQLGIAGNWRAHRLRWGEARDE